MKLLPKFSVVVRLSFVVYIRGAFHSGPYIGLGIQSAVQNTRSNSGGVRDSGVIETSCLEEQNAWNEEKLYSKKKCDGIKILICE